MGASKHLMNAAAHPIRPVVLAVCIALIAVVSAACGSQASSGSTARSETNVVLHWSDNHRTVTVTPGSSVRVVLGNTYWSFAPPSAGGILTPVGKPVVKPVMHGCVAGQGCGTVTAVYDATNQGITKISAGRTSCGEAIRCTSGRGAYTVTIKVAA